ncbi:hypothetical protein SFR_3680 [Streptomyces sp. FR-008]|nr:hypothetical protein SFR_3680 [Streptomyces sp. FR-008]
MPSSSFSFVRAVVDTGRPRGGRSYGHPVTSTGLQVKERGARAPGG